MKYPKTELAADMKESLDHTQQEDFERNLELQEVDLSTTTGGDDSMTTTQMQKNEDEGDMNLQQEAGELHSMTEKSHFRSDIVKTLLLCFSFMLLGLSVSALGPSLIRLSQNTGKTVEMMGVVFTIRGIGYVATAILVGLILDKFSVYSDTHVFVPKHPVLLFLLKRMEKGIVIVGMLLMALGMFLTPLLRSFPLLVVVNLMIGVGCGLVDCVSNIMLCWIWGDAVNPYMQALHFCFGVGAFVFPLLLQIAEIVFDPTKNRKETRFWNTLTLSYYPTVVLMIFGAVLFMFFSFEKSTPATKKFDSDGSLVVQDDDATATTPVHTEASDETHVAQDYPIDGTPPRNRVVQWVKSLDWKQITVCLLTGVALLFYVGSEVGYGGLIFTYVSLTSKDFEKTASLLTSAFWLSFTIGRLISIPISKYVSAVVMLVADLAITMLGVIVLVITSNKIVIWIASVVIGFAMASQYPATLALPTSHLNMKVSGVMTSIMVVCGALGEMVIPAIMARFIPQLMYILLGVIGVATVIYAVLLFGFRPNPSGESSKDTKT